jgi:hypothetical protein
VEFHRWEAANGVARMLAAVGVMAGTTKTAMEAFIAISEYNNRVTAESRLSVYLHVLSSKLGN